MAVLRERPYPGINFLVDLGDGNAKSLQAGVSEVVFPDARLHTLAFRSGNQPTKDVRHLVTTTRYGTLILRRHAIGALDWYAWWNALRDGEPDATRNITISLLNESRSDVVLVWKFQGAMPVNYTFSPLDALGTEPLMESLEIAFERFEMA
ncbi:MAG: phage tail protein [Rhodothermales bacterium]